MKARKNIMYEFDTYKFIKIIKNAGLTEEQAKAIVNIVVESREREYDFSKLTTHKQFELLSSQIKEIRQKIVTKNELVSFKQELKQAITVANLKILIWVLSFMTFIAVLLINIIAKLFH